MPNLPTGLCAELACIWEATARKPGNVHRERDFADLKYVDLLASAAAIRPVMDGAIGRPIGETILLGVRATRQVVSTNTNLGILLLLAPLAAAVPRPREGIQAILNSLDLADAKAVFEAIRLAVPGGMGQVRDQDILLEPSEGLLEIMRLAQERDLIALQYVDGFREIFDEGVPALEQGLDRFRELETAIIACHLHLMARHPDSLIARKRGLAEATDASTRAARVLEAGWPWRPEGVELFQDLDLWLRAVGHGRNPGTTADLVTACLFIALLQGILKLPSPYPWASGSPHD